VTARLAARGEASQPPADRRIPWILAVVSGLLQFLAFPPVGASWIAFVALVPLFWAAYGPGARPGFRRRFLIGFTAEAVYFAALLHWILYLSNQEVTIPGLMVPALLFMSAYLAAFFAFAIALAGTCQDRGGSPAPLLLPVFWVLMDYLRSLGVLGFPWGSLGYALAPHPEALQISAWTGFWALPLWILIVNALLFSALSAWLTGGRRGAAARAAAAAGVFAAPLVLGAIVLASAPPVSADAPRGFRMVMIQANTSREIKWKPGYEGIVIDDLLQRTRSAAEEDPDLIVWPETAAPVLVLWDRPLAERVSATIAELKRWVLVGTLDARLFPGGRVEDYNAAILYDPEGIPIKRYYKRQLVPFSEAMPFQKEIPWINALNFGQSDFTSGREKDLFTVKGRRFSVLICFESIFPRLAREAVAGGAQVLINTTNDFWFGRSAGPVQHAEMAIHRAVENRTPLARCANSGISFFVDPYGRVFGRTGLFVEAMPSARLAPGSGGSFYTRHGDWIVIGLLLAALVSLAQTLRAGGLPLARRFARRRTS
jgi:apolipoprotein N-acyltransferase